MAFLADGTVKLKLGAGINEFSIDGTLAGNADNAVPTEKAVKSYVDATVAQQPQVSISGTPETTGTDLIGTLNLTVTTPRLIHVVGNMTVYSGNAPLGSRASLHCFIDTTTAGFPGNNCRVSTRNSSTYYSLGFDTWASVTAGTFAFKFYWDGAFAGFSLTTKNLWVL
jgi:hypothetical protein